MNNNVAKSYEISVVKRDFTFDYELNEKVTGMHPEIDSIYGNRLRVRACGICWSDDKLLMVNHIGLSEGSFWAPPGGGVEFGESAAETLEREFREETGLTIKTGRFMCVCEYLNRPLHAIELFFEVTAQGGSLATGKDPEIASGRQMIASVAFMPFRRIREFATSQRHGLFEIYQSVNALKSASGYWKI